MQCARYEHGHEHGAVTTRCHVQGGTRKADLDIELGISGKALTKGLLAQRVLQLTRRTRQFADIL